MRTLRHAPADDVTSLFTASTSISGVAVSMFVLLIMGVMQLDYNVYLVFTQQKVSIRKQV